MFLIYFHAKMGLVGPYRRKINVSDHARRIKQKQKDDRQHCVQVSTKFKFPSLLIELKNFRTALFLHSAKSVLFDC